MFHYIVKTQPGQINFQISQRHKNKKPEVGGVLGTRPSSPEGAPKRRDWGDSSYFRFFI